MQEIFDSVANKQTLRRIKLEFYPMCLILVTFWMVCSVLLLSTAWWWWWWWSVSSVSYYYQDGSCMLDWSTVLCVPFLSRVHLQIFKNPSTECKRQKDYAKCHPDR
ncbi:hypothetical protein ASPBRDRAFT_537901 [Aspergillus brasiliensis CBS 101740]|uniref:Uncharacterized protein n=1 Tax=Aspergillus brasiliensis (strain CBS 101740 / IMI 381727 / IBT 21946) TaxID=767769 RepID=A0A1L9UKY9_ASPBC|nr:hypothetical protein ASPBRDRAFT_537901 [Aspergillus brasiliensis CBS 101740]